MSGKRKRGATGRKHNLTDAEKIAHDAKPGIGYRRPPEATRIQPGEIRNPRGRPKGHKNVRTDLLEELQTKIPLSEGGQITKQRALIRSLVNGGIQRNVPAARHALELAIEMENRAEGDSDPPLTIEEEAAYQLGIKRKDRAKE